MKKILVSIVAALLTVFMTGITVSAAQTPSTDIEKLVNSTNWSIEQEIKKTQAQADVLQLKYSLVTEGLENALRLVPAESKAYDYISLQLQATQSRYDAELDKLICNLIQTTNAMASKAISIAADNGVTVICELVEVQIGNRVVLIDPLRVSDT